MFEFMKPQTEELLNLLLWSADRLMNPTFRNLTDSFEGWSYRTGLMRKIASLEEKQMVERDHSQSHDRLYRLTWKGRLHALGGRDPQARWSREWDGRWRLVLFDVPIAQNSHRARLRRYLRERGFGYLQNSVWVTPDSLSDEREVLKGGEVNVESLLLLEARPCAGESDGEIVAGAWDFKQINMRYRQYMKTLGERPTGMIQGEAAARALGRWAANERAAWLAAVAVDPLLPERILPKDYLGRDAWARRVEVLREAARQTRSFKV